MVERASLFYSTWKSSEAALTGAGVLKGVNAVTILIHTTNLVLANTYTCDRTFQPHLIIVLLRAHPSVCVVGGEFQRKSLLKLAHFSRFGAERKVQMHSVYRELNTAELLPV